MTSLVNLTNFCSQRNGDIKCIFVKDDDIEQSNIDNVMEALHELNPDGDAIEVMDAIDCYEIDESEIVKKRFFFVFERFDTPAFKHVSEMKDVYIYGINCLLKVIRDNLEVDPSLFHINNLAMKDMKICFSSIGDPEKKSRMKKLIGYMGGLYSNSLTEDITHLVTEDIFSKKYHHAGSHNLITMHPSWVEDAWKLSQNNGFDRKADDQEFRDKYQLKTFYNLIFSSTGLDNDEKKKLVKLIEDNGGEYSHIFKTSSVKILIMRAKDIGSIKYKASIKHSIRCIDPSWILDSVEAGYALNTETYVIKKEGKLKSSTPTKNTSALGRFNFDNTMLSDISDITAKSINIDETQKSSVTRASTNLPPLSKRASSMSNIKPSTSLRPTKSNESVHKVAKNDTFKKPNMPTKKNENFTIPSPPKFDYSEDGSDESFIQILIDKVVCVYGYTADIDSMQVTKELEKLGAKLVDLSYNKMIDYVITSTEILDVEVPKIKYKNLVTDVWLEESVENGICIEPLKFYHHSLFKPLDKHQVLKGEVFVCSNYDTIRQRPFIRLLVRALGGICKEALSRAEAPILICPSPEGKKYEAARNWGLTVISAEWLLKCYHKKIRFDESDYLVGDTKVSSKNIKRRDSIIPCSQDMSNEICDEVDSHCESPMRKQKETDDPKTPTDNIMVDNENDGKVGNISWLLEDMPTPQRNVTRAVLLDHQKKNKVSPRTKLLKDLMQTPGNAQKSLNEYAPSPAPDLPQCLLPPSDGNFGLAPDSSPHSQWYYKRKIDTLDEQYVDLPESRRQALRDVAITPPFSHIRHDFFKKRLADFDSPDPRKKDDNLFYMVRVTANMSSEASKFLNFEDTENTMKNVPQDSDILKLDELLRRSSDHGDNNIQKPSDDVIAEEDPKINQNKNIIDYNPQLPVAYVRWSNTQAPDEDNKASTPNILADDLNHIGSEIEQINEHAKSHSENFEFIFAISSGNNGEEKQNIWEKIEKLGGKLAEQNFTHLIMTKISKSSKFFSALACGKHVLHSSYVDECIMQNKFIETDCFEFGNPRFNCAILNVKEPLLIEGPYKCRQLVKNNPEKFANGLFTGMKFILVASPEKIIQFNSVIESGGGIIVDEKSEFSTSVLKRIKVDYCLAENLKALTKKDIETLKSCNVQIKNVKFIYEYLLSNNNTSM